MPTACVLASSEDTTTGTFAASASAAGMVLHLAADFIFVGLATFAAAFAARTSMSKASPEAEPDSDPEPTSETRERASSSSTRISTSSDASTL